MPFGLCDWLDVVDIEGSMPHFAVDIQIRQEMAKISLVGEVYALSEMVDHMIAL